MSKSFKRILTMMLALIMLMSYLPNVTLHTHAVEAGWLDTFTVAGLGVECTDLVPDRAGDPCGTSQWTADGTTITNVLEQPTSVKAGSTTLTLKNNLAEEAHLSFKWEITKKSNSSKISYVTYDPAGNVITTVDNMFTLGTNGESDIILASGAYIVFTVYGSGTGRNSTESMKLKLMDLNLYVDAVVNTTFQAVDANKGSYTVNGELITADVVKTQKASVPYEVVATPAEGYVFSGWYSVTADTYLSTNTSATLVLEKDQTVYPIFIKAEDAVWAVGGAYFENLTNAIYCAERSSDKVVVLLKDYTLTGSNIIPKDVMLLVPFDAEATCYTTVPGTIPKEDLDGDGNLNDPAAWQAPYAYRTLTLAENAELIVKGGLSISAQHHGVQGYSGSPSGPCGFLVTSEGAKITVENGGALYAWGYVVGSGAVEAKSGAAVYENLQITDFRGGTASFQFVNTDTSLPEEELEKYVVFPFSQYYVQNVEIPLTIHSGAKEVVQVTLYVSGGYVSIPVDFIGTEMAMFRMESGAYITKAYDATADRMVFSVNGKISLNGMALEMSGYFLDSSMFNLPITNNITINVNSGITTVGQNVALLPGVEVNVAKNAKLVVGEGWDLYVYDRDQWVENYYVHPNTYVNPIRWTYANGTSVVRTGADLKDAKINVNGMLEAWGYLYTTESGANICSSEGTGVVVLWAGNGAKKHTYQTTQEGSNITFVKIPLTPAQLMNVDGSYTSVANAQDTGSAFIYDVETGTWSDVVLVQFHGNGATSGSVSKIEMSALDIAIPEDEYGNVYNKIVLPENGFARTGYAFVAWNTKADGSGTSYNPGDDFYVTGNVTLYAVWACQHANTSIKNAKEPTCTEEGYTGDLVCECGFVVKYGEAIEKAEHAFTKNLRGSLKTPGNCTTEAVYAVKCDNCTFESEKLTVKGEKDASKHTGKPVYTNNGETHSAAYDCCSAVYVTNEPHTYDQEGGKCICGAEKPHVCAENLTEHKAVTPDCQTVGNTAYWSCTCGKFYADAAAIQEIAKDSWILGKGDHAFTQNLRGSLKTPGNCTEEAVYTVKCDKCDFESEKLTVKGEKDASKHSGNPVYTNNGENHSAAYNCCGVAYVTNEVHKYEDATYKCVCGALYSGIYTDANGDKFFVVEGVAVANKGLVRVYENGEAKYYYFGCAATANDSHEDNSCDAYKAQKNCTHWVENTNGLLPAWDYTFGADGAIVYDDELNNNEQQSHEIVTYGDVKYYTIDGIKVPMGLVKMDGAYYYVRSNGALVCGQTYWVTKTNDLLPEGSYTFDAEGKMVDVPELPEIDENTNGIVGGYYYESGELTYAGLIEIEGKYYYVRSNGKLATGAYWVTKTNGLMPEASYNFDENGVMLNPNLLPEVDENTTGVVDGYYFENGVITYAGLIKLDGAYYYVRSNGQVAVGSYWISKTNGLLPEGRYTFAEDGKMVDAPEVPEVEEGFTGIKDGYYYENGVITYAGLIQLDGKYYYVRTSGKLATGKYWITKTNGLLPEGSYNFGADGAMIME